MTTIVDTYKVQLYNNGQAVADDAPVPVEIGGFEPVGDHITRTDLATAKTLTKPAGANHLWMQALTQNIRYQIDGSAPTASTGFQLAAGDPVVVRVGGNVVVKVIEETATAQLEAQWLT